jgi:hypothetical protein
VTSDTGDTVVRGKVVRIEPRDVVFQVDNKYYAIHVGESMEEAMKKTLSNDRLKAMGVAANTDKVSRGS